MSCGCRCIYKLCYIRLYGFSYSDVWSYCEDFFLETRKEHPDIPFPPRLNNLMSNTTKFGDIVIIVPIQRLAPKRRCIGTECPFREFLMNIIQLGTKKTMIGLLTQNLPFLATLLQPAFVQPPVLTLTFLPILWENTGNFLWPVLKLLFMKTPIYMNVLEMDFFRSLARQEVVLAGILSNYPMGYCRAQVQVQVRWGSGGLFLTLKGSKLEEKLLRVLSCHLVKSFVGSCAFKA